MCTPEIVPRLAEVERLPVLHVSSDAKYEAGIWLTRMILLNVSSSATRDEISINASAAMDASASPRKPNARSPDHPFVSLLDPACQRGEGSQGKRAWLTVSLADNVQAISPDTMPVVLDSDALLPWEKVDPALDAGRAGVKRVVRELAQDLRQRRDDEGRAQARRRRSA